MMAAVVALLALALSPPAGVGVAGLPDLLVDFGLDLPVEFGRGLPVDELLVGAGVDNDIDKNTDNSEELPIAEPAEPTGNIELIEPAGPTQPTEPTGNIELIEPAGPTQPAEPATKPSVEVDNYLPVNFPDTNACPRGVPAETLNHCIKTNLLAMIPHIDKAYKVGLPSLDPYYVPEVKIDFKSYIANFHAILSNMSAYGISQVRVLDARADLKDDSMDLEVDVFLPKMHFTGQFEFTNGFFSSMLHFTGHGPFHISFRDIAATWRFHGTKKPGSKYMITTKLVPTYTVGGMKFWAKNLVDGYPSLDDLIITIANRLWRDVIKFGKPAVAKQMAEHLWLLSHPVFRRIPYDVIFPPA